MWVSHENENTTLYEIFIKEVFSKPSIHCEVVQQVLKACWVTDGKGF